MTREAQVGDRIQVTGTVTRVAPNGCRVQFDGGNMDNTLLNDELAAGTLLPRPLKVGDRVRTYGGSVDGEVLVIHEDFAGVVWANNFHGFHSLSDLTLADSEGGK